MKLRRLSAYAIVLMLALSQTACLKTRAQIKGQGNGDSEEETAEDSRSASPARSSRYEIEEMKNEVTRLNGKVETLEHEMSQQKTNELKEYLTRIDSRVADLEKNQILVLSELKALKDEKAAAVKEASTSSSDIFAEANQLLSERKCDEAVEKFRTLVNRGLKGKEAGEAHFGYGEAEYCEKNYKKAIVQYSKVQEVHPKSSRIPQSLYKIGLAFQHLNMLKESKGFFNELIERYPKSPEAKKARSKVKE